MLFASRVTCCAALALLAAACNATHRSYLDEDELVLLEWDNNGTDISFTLTVNTTGWVGIGLSPSGGMTGADVVVGWVTAEGKIVLQDRYAEGKETPRLDAHQDYVLISGMEKDGQTQLKFSRKLDTCDVEDLQITDDTARVIYAYGKTDPVSTHPEYHGVNRGTRSAALLGLLPPPLPDGLSSETVDLRPIQTVNVPAKDTVYWCSLAKFPAVKERKHMIKWEPLIAAENQGVVHHMLLYGCYDKVDRSNHTGTNVSFLCTDTENMPQAAMICSHLIAVWTIGSETTVFPEGVGFPFDVDDNPGYVLIQTHYDNPLKRADIVDRSGFRLTLTSKLRQFDAGTLHTGHSLYGMVIPPGQKAFRVNAFCAGPCSAQAFPASGVNVFGVLLHAHLLGRQITVRHYRQDRELPLMVADRGYDFNFQQFRLISPWRSVLPGDTIHTTCYYDSRNRTNVTFGGDSTQEEMCEAFFLYYPKVNLTVCMTAPGWTSGRPQLYESLKLTPSSWNSTYHEAIAHADWGSNESSKAVQHLYDTGDMSIGCHIKFGSTIQPAHNQYWTAPEVSRNEPAQPQLRRCSQLSPPNNVAADFPRKLSVCTALIMYLVGRIVSRI